MQTATATDKTAEGHAQRLYGCAFEQLNDNQQRAIELLVDMPRLLAESATETRYCMTCGREGSLQQCMRCRDGQEDGYRPRYQSGV